MHHILTIIVPAKSKLEALSNAKRHLRQIQERDHHIDYGTFFDENKQMSGKNRWGSLEPAVLLDSKKGAQYLLYALEALYEDFIDNLNKIKKDINKPEQQLFNDNMFKYYGQCLFNNEWLFYKNEAVDVNELNSIFRNNCNNQDDNPGNLPLYIVPVDVHT
jgi:hypothetical protein